MHTRWIETEFRNDLAPWRADAAGPDGLDGAADRQTVIVEVDGKRLEVTLPATLAAGVATPPPNAARSRRQRAPRQPGAAPTGDVLAAPMQGTVIKVAVSEGQQVAAGDLVLVLEAMKMEQPVNAHKSGTITSLTAQAGATVTSGAAVCEIKDLCQHPRVPLGQP